MFTVWWLALAGLSVFQQPLPGAPDESAAIALASGRIPVRQPCYQLVCADAEWMAPTIYTTLSTPKPPGSLPRLRPASTSPLATRRFVSLHAPAAARDWVNARASDVRIGASYGVEAIRTPATDLRVQLGTGYRLRPYVEDGTATHGPIACGSLQFTQRLGERVQFDQQVQVETGRENTTARQTLGVDLLLHPQWTLQSQYELRHDTAGGSSDSEGSLKLHYAF